jgi:hypothetical protein
MAKIDSTAIHYKGTLLGYATPLDDSTTRLVLKQEAEQFRMLRKLIQKHGGLVIDVEEPHDWVKEQVLDLARRPDKKHFEPLSRPQTTQRLFLRGSHTYHYRDQLKELGLRWDKLERAWWTYNRAKYEAAKRLVRRRP